MRVKSSSQNPLEDDRTVYEKIDEVKNDPKFFETQKYLKVIPEKHRRITLKSAFILFFCVLAVGAGLGCLGYFTLFPRAENQNPLLITKSWGNDPVMTMSPLTGETLSDASLASSPTYCVQIPNGLDGARPQAGLNEAGVVFEAIAEAGITRFAAIFQNPSSTIIGPIRSLRIYYLDWDTPFDCTIVHAGGSDEAIAAIASGAYHSLSENDNYTWRGATNTFLNRQWNNLFTANDLLESYSKAVGFTSSNVKGFPRNTEKTAKQTVIETLAQNPLNIDEKTDSSVKTLTPKVSEITFKFGNNDNFNPTYRYNQETNSYNRFYGENPHTSYDCIENQGNVSPEIVCGDPVQISPKVVIAMMVEESLSADGIHESIRTLATGKAYVFQNGDVIEGTWEKSSKDQQIVFKNNRREEIRLTPGNTWISAIPLYGSVDYKELTENFDN